MENLLLWVFLVALGFFFGRLAESRHYRSIVRREKEWLHLPTTTSKHPIGDAGDMPPIARSRLAHGSVVVSIDYFKRMLAALRSLVGGAVQSHETLLDRARREAILRLKESCPDADQIINLRLETSSISNGSESSIGSVEVIAYGTALYFERKQ
ncbi:MAG TPA: heavy metal-binding domain-containing protein [Paucimonas sp.]|nr:heavy metal-binding domain-containing protein [Paucimonas sp.]